MITITRTTPAAIETGKLFRTASNGEVSIRTTDPKGVAHTSTASKVSGLPLAAFTAGRCVLCVTGGPVGYAVTLHEVCTPAPGSTRARESYTDLAYGGHRTIAEARDYRAAADGFYAGGDGPADADFWLASVDLHALFACGHRRAV